MKLKVLDQKGKEAEEITVDDSVFKAERNDGLIHEVAVALQNNQRQGTKSTLTRSEVRGHAKKPYRQKGTGRARQGSTKGPHQDGGGVAFAPKPRDFRTKINKKKKDAAFISAISAKLADKELIVLKTTKIAAGKTKNVAKIIDNVILSWAKDLSKQPKVMFVTADIDTEFVRSVNNIPTAGVTPAAQLSVLDLVTYKYIVASVDAVRAIEGAYSGSGLLRRAVTPRNDAVSGASASKGGK